MSAPDEIAVRAQMDAFAKSIEALNDRQLCAHVERPDTRAKVLTMRESLAPWLETFNRVANADRRLAKALNRTARERRI